MLPALYATVLDLPDNGDVTIQSLGSNMRLYTKPIGKVELLGSKAALKWSQTVRGLKVRLPAEKPDERVLVLKVSPKK